MGPSYYEQVQTAIRRLGPKPSNAQALALVDAFGTLPMADADLDQALPTVMHFRWLAHGYKSAGDKFAAPSNARFYAAAYPEADALAGTLRWVAGLADKNARQLAQQPALVVIDDATAKGTPSAIAQELAQSWEALQQLRSLGVEPGPPLPPKGKARPDVQPPDEPVRRGESGRAEADADVDPDMVASWRDLGTTPGVPPRADAAVAANPDGTLEPGDIGKAIDGVGRKAREEAERLRRIGRARKAQAQSAVVLVALILVVAAWRRR